MATRENSIVVLLLALVALALSVSLFFWGFGSPYGGPYGMMGGMMGYGWGFMFLIPLAFLLLVGVGIYYLVTTFTRTSRPSFRRGERALEILRERYARGEITREEYVKMKEQLEA